MDEAVAGVKRDVENKIKGVENKIKGIENTMKGIENKLDQVLQQFLTS